MLQRTKVWRGVSLPDHLVKEIEEVIIKTKRYRSISEFVSEAIRLRLEEIQKDLRREAVAV
ncbi:ribbon-helix-helix protein, CopG family [Candidatus Bathyarchaeota archaeon]|nr:MAG: ribbon-helix-helix protein, CopG family [Candidatus Bathyarchaeota archaeon]